MFGFNPTRGVHLIVALGFRKPHYVTSISHLFQSVGVFSLNRNAVSSLRAQALNVDK